MYRLIASLLFLSLVSCVPLSIAPKIESYKIVKAKRFKRDLPRSYSFVFHDPKDVYEFYQFIDMKFDLGGVNIDSNVPFRVGEKLYFLSFYEREKSTQTLNLIPIAIDLKRKSNGNDPLLGSLHSSRSENWYLILTVSDGDFNDCLAKDYQHRTKIIEYLNTLREEYLRTHNYMETYLKRE